VSGAGVITGGRIMVFLTCLWWWTLSVVPWWRWGTLGRTCWTIDHWIWAFLLQPLTSNHLSSREGNKEFQFIQHSKPSRDTQTFTLQTIRDACQNI